MGYHTNADGSLEKVAGAQVYAWMFGVDVNGAHVDVQSGDRVWYDLIDDGGVSVMAVQSEQPAGADGSIVARDLAYADRLGVMDPGTYQAYAYFDAGAGFAPTALAEATVEVTAPTKAAPAKAASSPKTGDLDPRIVSGVAVVALIAAGALALSRRRA